MAHPSSSAWEVGDSRGEIRWLLEKTAIRGEELDIAITSGRILKLPGNTSQEAEIDHVINRTAGKDRESVVRVSRAQRESRRAR